MQGKNPNNSLGTRDRRYALRNAHSNRTPLDRIDGSVSKHLLFSTYTSILTSGSALLSRENDLRTRLLTTILSTRSQQFRMRVSSSSLGPTRKKAGADGGEEGKGKQKESKERERERIRTSFLIALRWRDFQNNKGLCFLKLKRKY